ncbi:hypothetical protein SAMN05518854_1309 [Variovorax sp. YR266]|uniref:hypothetical protein n=1 Tax=Variovorax sp. YR266 TaxID=1884386 RepID=UPI00089585A5|nr:hypothetical protein [Variovorax sp. YR266]SDZ72378.1 hypothetical protein SAMN05518854_1309 [Variovorax sp. YR266]
MSMATHSDLHADRVWGEAAVLLSLDLTAGLWEFLDTGLDYQDVLRANRQAILESRKGLEKPRSTARMPRSRISEIAQKHAAPIQRGVLSYAGFVEETFSGFRGYVRNECFFNPLLFDCLNFKQSLRDRLESELGEDFDANAANKSFDERRAMMLGRQAMQAMQVDRAIESGRLSTWDRELLEKHRGTLGAVDPLGTVIHLGVCQLKNEAVKKFVAKLKPDARSKLRSIFNQIIETH